MKENKTIRIILTIGVLLLGGYYIQKTSTNNNTGSTLTDSVNGVKADTYVPPSGGGK